LPKTIKQAKGKAHDETKQHLRQKEKHAVKEEEEENGIISKREKTTDRKKTACMA